MDLNRTADRTVLALNAGSSSLKFGLYSVERGCPEALLSGTADAVEGGGYGRFHLADSSGSALQIETATEGEASPIDRMAGLFDRLALPAPTAVGHRIVHGGPACRRHALVDADVMRQLEAARTFAPLHMPPAMDLLTMAQKRYADIPHVACLDTAFHVDMPPLARVLPLPRRFRDMGVERYGFHGLSCESIVHQLGDAVPPRLVVAHLGHGSSVTAIAGGRSVDTSMGLTPAGGTIMSTRCGDIDPGTLVYLLRESGCDADDIDTMIHRESGMLAVSGLSGDMRKLRKMASQYAEAKLAIDMFCQSVRKHIAAMCSVLGGVDLLVFTGGIGEHDAETRASICEGLPGMGISRIITLPSDEAMAIAWHTCVVAAIGE